MSTDLLGPASAVGAVTERPAETRGFGMTDTWFAPCTSPESRDGTQIQAVWLNALLDQIRYALRASGIPLDNADSSMLWQAMQAAMTGGVAYGVASGTATQLIVETTTPTLRLPYEDGALAVVDFPTNLALGTNATIRFADGDRTALLRNDGSRVQSGDGPAGSQQLMVCKDGAWKLVVPQAAILRIRGTQPIYVSTDGNDNNDSLTSGTALRTLEAAFDLYRGYYTQGKRLPVQLVRPGTYPFPSDYAEMAGRMAIRGNTNAQADYILDSAGAGSRGGAFEADGFDLALQGLLLRNRSTDRFTAASSGGGRLSLLNVTLTSPAPINNYHLYVSGDASASINPGVIWASSAAGMMSVRKGDIGITTGAVLEVRGNPTWGVAAAVPLDYGTISVRGGARINGLATGKRYDISAPGIIRGAADDFFPGTLDGTVTDPSGRYIP